MGNCYEAHVGMSSEEEKVVSYTHFKGEQVDGGCSFHDQHELACVRACLRHSICLAAPAQLRLCRLCMAVPTLLYF